MNHKYLFTMSKYLNKEALDKAKFAAALDIIRRISDNTNIQIYDAYISDDIESFLFHNDIV